ncbi:hypothetical protein BDV29DRAFT_175213 [Aspergillus leporis]|uniref:Uncharacterized protein n=1 Tax=Aspergillus leporis TaxID=41062 RepID=A0A5N5X2M5_9EURO|nr:hypothetical protein BDV29DRAFT_175213 [Aspergillus leporis]
MMKLLPLGMSSWNFAITKIKSRLTTQHILDTPKMHTGHQVEPSRSLHTPKYDIFMAFFSFSRRQSFFCFRSPMLLRFITGLVTSGLGLYYTVNCSRGMSPVV